MRFYCKLFRLKYERKNPSISGAHVTCASVYFLTGGWTSQSDHILSFMTEPLLLQIFSYLIPSKLLGINY